jgi:hypothetical protein
MALKDFDFKQFMVEKGERVGLGAAGVVAVLLIGCFLFWPGHGVFSKSPTELAAELNKAAADAETKLRTSQPGEADKPKDPELDEAAKKRRGLAFAVNVLKATDALHYMVAGWFQTEIKEDAKRRNPELLTPDDGRAAVVLAQVQTYIFSPNWKQISVLKGGTKDKTAGGGQNNARLQQLYGGNTRGVGNIGRGNLMAPTNNMAPPEGATPSKQEWVDLDKLGDTNNARPAQTVRPLRMALLALAFPYKQQLDEFKFKLRHTSYNGVITEPSNEFVDENQKEALPAFRFLGVNVERRIVDVTGKPITNQLNRARDGWEKIDIETSFKPWIIMSGKRIQQDDKDLDPIEFDGLVMPRLLQAREGQYPEIERDMKSIQVTLESLKQVKPEQQRAVPQQFNGDTFNPFRKTGSESSGKGPAAMTKPGAVGSEAFKPPMGTTNPNDKTGGDAKAPDHCLIRLVDVTIKPGVIYQYRVQVRMANPNYKRTDVANPKYAEYPELGVANVMGPDGKYHLTHEDKWYVIGGADTPLNVSVPPERLYFAVDQKPLDLDRNSKVPSDYRCVGFGLPYARDHQAVFQIHQWLEELDTDKKAHDFTPVGEWAVAERIVVNRGEYIGRKVRVEVPVWMPALDTFHLAASGSANKRITGVEVDFANPVNETILIDFEGGPIQYQRPGALKVQEDTTLETVMLSPEGKLLAHDSQSDTNNIDRKNRLVAWRERIKDVKEPKTGDNKPTTGTPFGK